MTINQGRGRQRVARLPEYPERGCLQCSTEYKPYKIDQRFCTPACQRKYHGRLAYLRRHGNTPPAAEGVCGVCGDTFKRVDRYDWRRRYCSEACGKEAKRRSRKRFHQRNPGYKKREEFARNGGWTSTVTRFFRRCPEVARKCAVCGEERVVDIHHRTRRNGAPPRARNTQREHVWVLCPNHHAMLHRGVSTPEELGLR